jgi:hypothetical protein
LPEENHRRDYGFASYGMLKRTAEESLSREQVLERARELGYARVIELREGAETVRHLVSAANETTRRTERAATSRKHR